MKVKIIDPKRALIYQSTTDDDTVLPGEPALLVEEYNGSGLVTIESEEGYVNINYDTLPVLVKLFQGILKDKSFFDIKF